MKYEYRTAIAKGPMSASQLTDQFGAGGWELVDIFPWEHQGKRRVFHYFRRYVAEDERLAGGKSESVISLVPSLEGDADAGQGSDEVEVRKE